MVTMVNITMCICVWCYLANISMQTHCIRNLTMVNITICILLAGAN